MHPADEFEAFKALIDEGKGVKDVAARFGVSVLTVRRRLKLSALSPKLLALYREDGINLDQLMTLTLSDDHAVQERAWFDAQPWDAEDLGAGADGPCRRHRHHRPRRRCRGDARTGARRGSRGDGCCGLLAGRDGPA